MTSAPVKVLVTGGTGRLGRVLVPLLHSAGHPVAAGSRQPRGAEDGRRSVRLDLVSGDGLAAAFEGMDVVVHLATANGRADIAMMRNLLAAAGQRAKGEPPQVIYLSIVGCDQVPLPYYRYKTEAEGLALASGLPVTVLRSTQFHSLVAQIFSAQRWLPGLLVPAIPMQPIDEHDVARRLLELVEQPAAGRVGDIGGPETQPLSEFARQWLHHQGRPARLVPLRLPGKTFGAYSAGRHLAPGPPFGRHTFAEFPAGSPQRD